MSRGKKTIEKIFAKYPERVSHIYGEDGVWWIEFKPGWCLGDNPSQHHAASPLIAHILQDVRQAVQCECGVCVEESP